MRLIIFSVLTLLLIFNKPCLAKSSGSRSVISQVNTDLTGSQKYFLQVDGKPFYPIDVQVRLDLLRYSLGWNGKTIDALMKQVASDGFNTVCIPVHWYEVEPQKNKFDWSILDYYLSLAQKNNLKLEMLWFGANSGGHVQWLSRSKELPNHLRTPDYVLYSPKPGSPATTSEYRIRRDMSNYSMDMTDDNLCKRETEVLSQVMAHIAEWDAAHGNKHTLIGVQINNEAIGMKGLFSNAEVLSYLNRVASAVKTSNYVVWTRANCVFWNITSRIMGNEEMRKAQGDVYLDFVGIDTYRHHLPSDQAFVASMRDNLPYVGKNFRMIMETNSDIAYSAQMHLAALSGNAAFDYYSIEGLYGREGNKVKPLVDHIGDIRMVNKILGSDTYDIATKSQGYDLFVHNWEGCNAAASVSNLGITFKPGYPTSQGVSIKRSNSEIVLMTTKGGIFLLPKDMKVNSVSKGYFRDNVWKTTENVDFATVEAFDTAPKSDQKALRVGAGETLLVRCEAIDENEPSVIYQAENAVLRSGAEHAYSIDGIGFGGNGFVRLPAFEGANVCWKSVNGKNGGEKTLRIRYSNGSCQDVNALLFVNGKLSTVKLKKTGGWDKYQYATVKVNLAAGTANELKLESRGNFQRINRVVYPLCAGYIDEFQIF